MKLQDVLQKSTYSIEPGRYCVAKVTDSFDCANCFMVSKDDFETTVICKEEMMQESYLEIKKIIINWNKRSVSFLFPWFYCCN